MPVTSPLTATGRIAPKDLDAYLKQLASGPKNVAQTEIQSLLQAGEARLPEGASTTLQDALFALQNDAWDPSKKSAWQRPAPAKLNTLELQREKSMDGTAAQGSPVLELSGKCEPNARVEVVNLSRVNQPVLQTLTADANGALAFHGAQANAWYGDEIGLRVVNPQTGARSDIAGAVAKSVDVQVWKDKRESVAAKIDRQETPFVQANLIDKTQSLATSDDPQQHMVLAGKALSVPSRARLEAVIDNVAQAVTAMPDGSFLFDVKGVKPGTQLELRVVDQGMVGTSRFQVPALKFDPAKLAASTQGVPYDRAGKDGGVDAKGPFLRFALDQAVDPGSTVVVTNNTTGASFSAVAGASGKIDLEIAGVHAGDSLAFSCHDAAGNVAGGQVENWPVPASPNFDMRLQEILCGQTMLGAQVDEALAILKRSPTSVNRDLVKEYLADGGAKKIPSAADRTRLLAGVDALYGADNNIVTNASNPEPKEPIVIGARVIKPRMMDGGPTYNRDPLEVEGKAEPFSTIEIRNASVQGAPVVGTVTADKNGDFKFVNRDESKFQHGDQLYVKATDQGGASSKSAIAHTCAYELQVWTQQPRQQLVELPHATDARPPFIDMSKVTPKLEPIAKNGKSQQFTFSGGPGSTEPNAVLRVTTKRGTTCEAKSNPDGSFKLPVGDVTPGETLSLIVADVNGQIFTQKQNTAALKFDQHLATSSSGVPYHRLDAKGAPDGCGPFLDFAQKQAVDPFSIVTVLNNSTGAKLDVQANENGDVSFALPGVHSGDSLSFTVADPAGNAAPNVLENFIVPATPTLSDEVQALSSQREYLKGDVDKLLGILAAAPTAANRDAFEAILAPGGGKLSNGDRARLELAIEKAFAGANNVRSTAENPAPKEPIVLDADIIKPRPMDGGTMQGRDPLVVRGKAEPYTTVEIKNASQAGFPLLTSVQADKNGDWQVSFRDETKFLHGDQLLLRATDQGGAASKSTVVTTCAYELRVWNNPPRTEKVKLDKTTDTRPPFLDTSKVTNARTPIAKDGKEQNYVVTGAAMASEPNAIVRVTNKKGESYETKVKIDGSFEVKVGNHEPGESLAVVVVDGNGQIFNHKINTPALKFDPQKLVDTSEGAPYQRTLPGKDGAKGELEPGGPFLRFMQDAACDPFTLVTVKNNSTGKVMGTQADANGRVDIEIGGVHSGDSLTLSACDPASNKAPSALVNYVVPGIPKPNQRLLDLTCQQTLMKEHVDEALGLIAKSSSAADRDLVEGWLQKGESTFTPASEKARIVADMAKKFVGPFDIHTDATNPAPKEPIVFDARIIKPRVMDQGNAQNRDPLEVSGTAEPFTFIEIRNASIQGAPSLGRVQADENGNWKLTNRDESKFVHGDQLLIKAVDQGNASSKEVLSKTCQYELQVWNSTQKTELVRLPETTDQRPPLFVQSEVAGAQTIASKDKPQTFSTFTGKPLSAEPRTVIRFEGKNGVLGETKVNDDGSFKIDVGNYLPGETLKATCIDTNGTVTSLSFKTEALKFDPAKLLQDVDGPPYQKLIKGDPITGGPFLRIKADQVAFPGAVLNVMNHSTGKVLEFTADAQGSFDVELKGTHAFDLLTFKVKDAAGNEAPQSQHAWQVPAESKGIADPTIVALTSQRPVTEEVVDLLIEAITKQPTAQHKMLVDGLLRQHPNWFTSGKEKLEKSLAEIFSGPHEIVPDPTNPAPKTPVVLGAEIIKPRVMDSGNPPRDPMVISGLAEPLSTIEIYNGSVQGRPLVGQVQVGEDGKFAFTCTDESKFGHGDQLVVSAKDAGGAVSEPVVTRAKAFELRIWNQTNRREKVALDKTADARDPFLVAANVKTELCDGTKAGKESYALVGAPGSTEVYGEVSVTVGANTFTCEADVHGAFRLPVDGLELGKPVTIQVEDPNGRVAKATVTPAV